MGSFGKALLVPVLVILPVAVAVGFTFPEIIGLGPEKDGRVLLPPLRTSVPSTSSAKAKVEKGGCCSSSGGCCCASKGKKCCCSSGGTVDNRAATAARVVSLMSTPMGQGPLSAGPVVMMDKGK